MRISFISIKFHALALVSVKDVDSHVLTKNFYFVQVPVPVSLHVELSERSNKIICYCESYLIFYYSMFERRMSVLMTTTPTKVIFRHFIMCLVSKTPNKILINRLLPNVFNKPLKFIFQCSTCWRLLLVPKNLLFFLRRIF